MGKSASLAWRIGQFSTSCLTPRVTQISGVVLQSIPCRVLVVPTPVVIVLEEHNQFSSSGNLAVLIANRESEARVACQIAGGRQASLLPAG